MRISKRIVWWISFFLLATSSSLLAQANGQQEPNKSCRYFVQGFYDWYVSKAADTALKPSPLDLALRIKSHAFSSGLRRQLKELLEAQAKDREVWLDVDPLLNSQDPAESYTIGKVTRGGGSYRVEVYDIRSGTKSEEPVVVPELVIGDGRWVFVNIHYPNSAASSKNDNLLSILQSIREARQKQTK
jgi:hypothetical protein